jgi:hypothetical protein
LWVSFLVWIVSGCEEMQSKGGKQTSSGKTAEILVVTSLNSDIKGMIGDTIRYHFYQDFELLPQPEVLFELSFIDKAGFETSEVLKTHHNILFLDIDKDYPASTIEKLTDLWATPQTMIRIKSPDKTSLIKIFMDKRDDLTHIFTKNEMKRLHRFMKPYLDENIIETLHKGYHVNMEIPNGFFIAKKTANFVWLRREKEKTGEGILLYFYPYTDTLAFQSKRIISFRDSITKMYIPGPSDGSYMTTEKKYMLPVHKKINFNGIFAVETRGLWRVENDFMGGPFVNYTLVDEKNQQVVTFDAYAYNPNKGTRDMMIQLMAIIQTYTPVKDTITDN